MVVVTFLIREIIWGGICKEMGTFKNQIKPKSSQLATKRKPPWKISCELYNPKCDYNTKSPFPLWLSTKYVATTFFNIQALLVIAYL